MTPLKAIAEPVKGSLDVSCMSLAQVPAPACARSYGGAKTLRHVARATACGIALLVAVIGATARAEPPVKIVALGDSLTAGLGLPPSEGFVPRLQAALAARGIAAEITNAGVSGDTASGGLARLDWSVPEGTDAVILELGANDMLRGIRPQITRDALDAILHRLAERHIAVLLCGMRAAPNLGRDFAEPFERIYPELAVKYGTLAYPFFLDGVAGNLTLVQHDGIHPTAAGVDAIVTGILPSVEQLISRSQGQHPT